MKFLRAFQQIAVSRERVQREIVSIEMIFQIKHAGESSARKLLLIPGAVRILLIDQVRHGSLYGRIVALGGGKKADQTPGSLRWRAAALPFQFRIVVRSNRFAKTTILVLDSAQPRDRSLAVVAGAE